MKISFNTEKNFFEKPQFPLFFTMPNLQMYTAIGFNSCVTFAKFFFLMCNCSTRLWIDFAPHFQVFWETTTTIINTLYCILCYTNFLSNFGIIVPDGILYLPNSPRNFLIVPATLSPYLLYIFIMNTCCWTIHLSKAVMFLPTS